MLLLNILRAATDGAERQLVRRYMGVIRNTNCRNRRNPWKSLELPIRPPMLPLSESKIVLMTPADILANRPAPPPSTKSAAFATELAEVKTSAEIREQMRIVTYWADGGHLYSTIGI
jgi:hypothetical protein